MRREDLIKNRLESLDNNVINKKSLAKVPPMGWNSWNTFGGNISEEVIKETADAMKTSGLYEVGYNYVVIDDGYLERKRDSQGKIIPDVSKFPRGFKPLADYIHSLGLKFGMYNSAGTGTCMGLAGSWGYEKSDAEQFAGWEIDYFKYDFCNNPIAGRKNGVDGNTLCPNIIKIIISDDNYEKEYYANCGQLIGKAELRNNMICNLGDNDGEVIFNIESLREGIFDLSIHYVGDNENNKGRQIKVDINGEESEIYYTPIIEGSKIHEIKYINIKVHLKEGNNSLRLYNPFENEEEASIDGAIRSYYEMAKALNSTDRDILLSICEWGERQPWIWGSKLGHIWRTTCDITFCHGEASWKEIIDIYEKNVVLSEYATSEGWNDPDMLVVGLKGLTYEENKSHFSLWCMMAAPLMIGNDIRNMNDDIKRILTNKELIKLNQDILGKQGFRVKKTEDYDILLKPLYNNELGVLIINKSNKSIDLTLSIDELYKYITNVIEGKDYNIKDLWDNELILNNIISINNMPSHDVKVYRISNIIK